MPVALVKTWWIWFYQNKFLRIKRQATKKKKNGQAIVWEKNLSKCMFDIGLVVIIYKELSKLNQKRNNPIKRVKDLNTYQSYMNGKHAHEPL